MASDPYEVECMRAELLGLEKPDKEQFLLQEAERKKAEVETAETEEAKEIDLQDESMNRSGGKLNELNAILSRTGKKLSKFKETASGSFSGFLSRASFDLGSHSNEESKHDENEENGDGEEKNDINEALDDLDKLKENSTNSEKSSLSLNIEKKMTSQLSKLDNLISSSEQAEISMSEQRKTMKKYINK